MNILNTIVLHTKETLPQVLKRYAHVARVPRNETVSFVSTILSQTHHLALIGEIKKSSPSTGSFCDSYTVSDRARIYAQSGIDAISVVTDERFFGGSYEFVQAVSRVCTTPILMKDFIVHEAQIELAARLGTHALLLIARILSPSQLKEYIAQCKHYQIDPVVEIYDELELGIACDASAELIAVNARDLRTFQVHIPAACRLGALIPKEKIYLAFSGVQTATEIEAYGRSGAKAVLIGSALMKTKQIPQCIRSLQVAQCSYATKT
jgi:indole-3-glycerol phosphate synthase